MTRIILQIWWWTSTSGNSRPLFTNGALVQWCWSTLAVNWPKFKSHPWHLLHISTYLRKTYEHTGETLWNKSSGVRVLARAHSSWCPTRPGELSELFLVGWIMAGAKRHPGSECSRQSTLLLWNLQSFFFYLTLRAN